jgi:acetyl-CoA C-acetyltransferase
LTKTKPSNQITLQFKDAYPIPIFKETPMPTAYIISAQRTAVGSFQGQFSQIAAPRLGATAIQAALAKSNLAATDIEECIMGQVLTAGVGQAPARQAAIFAGLPAAVPCLTINKVCGSGLKAITLAADNILLGTTQVAVAGGQENMTLAPHLLENSRAGYRMGPIQMTDSMIKDGLWDPYSQFHMGQAAELCVREFKFSREAQDEFAVASYTKAHAAAKKGWFKNEIAPFTIQNKGETLIVDSDEEPGKARFEKIPTLKPAFEKDGTITAANASKINDGGAAVILASEQTVKAKGLQPIAKIVAHATFAQDPKWFTTAPVGAIKKVLNRAGLKISDIDLFEVNEAFAVVTMVTMKELGIPADKMNVNGGAIAIGHPLGASGARILTTLVHALHTHNKRFGLASLCIGGGEGIAVIVERV